MDRCLLVQPIHPRGIQRLKESDIDVLHAPDADANTVMDSVSEATAIITRNAGLSGEAMRAAPLLRVVGIHGTGYDGVDIGEATRRGVAVTYTPLSNAQSVAEHALMLILALAKKAIPSDAAVRDGDSQYRHAAKLQELQGKTLGIVGFGTIGRRVAHMAHSAFEMRLIVHSPSVPKGDIADAGFEHAPELADLLRRSDVVSLHGRLTSANRCMIGANELGQMKASSVLINTARGALVDLEALSAALLDGTIAGAGLDVLELEPINQDHAILSLPQVVFSPHVAGATQEALVRTSEQVVDQVIAILRGKSPVNVINPEVLEHQKRIT